MNATAFGKVWMPALVVLLVTIVGLQGFALYRLNERVAAMGATAAGPNPRVSLALQSQQQPPAAQSASPHAHSLNGPFGSFGPPSADPFAGMQQMHRQMQAMFEQFMNHPASLGNLAADPFGDLAGNMPSLREEKDRYVVSMEVPGVEDSKIDVSVDDGVLRISGRQEDSDGNNNAGIASRRQRVSEFEQSITLPGPVDSANMKTKVDHDRLVVTIPKLAPARQRSSHVVI